MIITVTLNPAVDHTITVQGALEPGEVTRTGLAQYDAGGKGINVSKYLAAMGAETLATGVVGGPLGRYVEDRLDHAGIQNDFVEMGGDTRLNTSILADDGEYKLNQPGHRVHPTTVDDVIAVLDTYDPDAVVVAGSLPPGLGPDAVDRIADAGDWTAVVDVRGPVLRRLQADYGLAAPNRDELAAATGQSTSTIEECRDAASTLRAQGFDRVLASLGPDGAVLAGPDGVIAAPATDVDVVDTAGAGDALLAGVLSALTRNAADRDALRHGMAAAARVVGVQGTTVPSLGDLDDASTRVTVNDD